MFSTECIKTDFTNPFPNFETIFIINYLSLEYMDLVIEVYKIIINAKVEASNLPFCFFKPPLTFSEEI